MRSDSSQATDDVIIAPFDRPVVNTRAVSMHSVASASSSSAASHFRSAEPSAVSHWGTGAVGLVA